MKRAKWTRPSRCSISISISISHLEPSIVLLRVPVERHRDQVHGPRVRLREPEVNDEGLAGLHGAWLAQDPDGVDGSAVDTHLEREGESRGTEGGFM